MPLETLNYQADVCVVGGGLAGLCAAVSAARHGARVLLMHERPVLGGNASSEIRMWVSGARGRDNRETGLLEEIMMVNQHRNPDKNWSVWDSVLMEKAWNEKNLTLLLNCSCMDAQAGGGRIRSVTGWQMTTQRFCRVEAGLFIDCSGDSILAPLTGAAFRQGREARVEFNESIAPLHADGKTMGLTCLMQAEETRAPQTFIPPASAETIREEQLKGRTPDLEDVAENFWYLELGGDRDSIGDSETLRDELLRLNYGMWDYLKNDPGQRDRHRNWRLSWMGALPGKRESRRYIGPHTLTENEILSGGLFPDVVAFGGWTMDDHHPAGFRTQEAPNIFHPAPSPYGIPFGCLYSSNIDNLLFAGRNISATHAALSSTRVMGTCALLGQAAGTAAALAVRHGCLPRDVAARHIGQLQDMLQQDDCFLPGFTRRVSRVCAKAALSGDGEGLESLRGGVDRPRPGSPNAWTGRCGDRVTYAFSRPAHLRSIRIVADSDLNRETLPELESRLKRGMFHNRLLGQEPSHLPKTLLKAYRVVAGFADGSQAVAAEVACNIHRLCRHEVDLPGCVSLTLEPLSTWGAETVRLFAFEAGESHGFIQPGPPTLEKEEIVP